MKRRILLVDDELAILLTLRAILEMNGFEVETASSGGEAIAKLQNGGQYHMVITDLKMETEAAGQDVIRVAKQLEHRPAVAVLTAFPTLGSGWKGEGADSMLVKPMNTGDLLRQIEVLLIQHEDAKQRLERAASRFGGNSKQKNAGKTGQLEEYSVPGTQYRVKPGITAARCPFRQKLNQNTTTSGCWEATLGRAGRDSGLRETEGSGAGCGGAALLETLPAENRPPLCRLEGHSGFLATLRADGARLHLLVRGVSRRGHGAHHRSPLGLAGLTALGLVLKLLIVKEQLLPGRKDEIRTAVDTLQHLVLEFHEEPSLSHP